MFRGGKISGPNWKRRIACRRVSPPRRTSPDYSRAGNHGAKRTMLARSVSEDNSQPSPRLLFYSSRLVRDRESSEMVTNNFLEFNVSGTLRVPRANGTRSVPDTFILHQFHPDFSPPYNEIGKDGYSVESSDRWIIWVQGHLCSFAAKRS